MLLGLIALCESVKVRGGLLVDQKGRQLVFHGVNVVFKRPPYHPILTTFQPNKSFCQEDMAALQARGLNGIRLGVMWAGVQKGDGLWDEEYLDKMEWIVNTAGKYGISTLVQFHQDIASEFFCGDGIPVWLMNKISNWRTKSFPLPLQLKPYHLNSSNHSYNLQDCAKHPWGNYYFTEAVGSTFDKLYHNKAGLRDHFIRYWKKVATKFRNNPNVIAYELINQPFAGDAVTDPLVLLPMVAERKNLQPFYDAVAKGIREVDSQTPLCFEPVTWDNTFSTGFTHPPGGDSYANSSILCYHLYKPPAFNLTAAMSARIKDAKKLKVGSMLSQFYFSTQAPEDLLALAQDTGQSWLMWGYKDFANNFTGLFLKREEQVNSVVDLKLLTRTYSQVIAGQLLSQRFDVKTKQFISRYKSCGSCGQTVVFYYPGDYPNGLTVTVEPASKLRWQRDSSLGLVSVFGNNLMPGEQVSISITAL